MRNKTEIFSIPTSEVLKRFDYWITTNTTFTVNLHKAREKITFSSSINFEVDLNTSSLSIDLVNSSCFSFILISKEGLKFGEIKGRVALISRFDKLILIENFTFPKTFKRRFLLTCDTTNSQKLLVSMMNMVGNRGVTILSRRKFYSFHEVCFIPARGNNVESYVSLITGKMEDFSEEDIWRAQTILYEVFDNAIEHGSKFNENKMIKVETLISNNGLHAIVSDQGEGFELSDINLTLDQDKPTGRGIMMIKMLSDVFSVKDKGRTTSVFVARSNSQYIPFFH